MEAFDDAKVARCLRFIVQELGFPHDCPTGIHVGDQAALQMVNGNQTPTVQIRHLDRQFFNLQDLREEQSIAMVHVAGTLNPSDVLTEPLAFCLHARRRRMMMGHSN